MTQKKRMYKIKIRKGKYTFLFGTKEKSMVFTKVKFAKITKEKKNEVKNYKLC